MRILFLDDNEARHKSFRAAHIGYDVTHVHTVAEALVALRTQERFDIASLDHDLDEQATLGNTPTERTGFDVCQVIANVKGGLFTEEEAGKVPRLVVIHSFNPVGAARMANLLRAWGVPVYVQPFRGIYSIAHLFTG